MKLGLVACAIGMTLAGCVVEGHPGKATSGSSGEDGEGSSGAGSSGGLGSSGSAGSSGSSASGGSSGVTPGATAKCALDPKPYGSLKMWECTPPGMEGKTATPAGLVVAMHGYTQGVVQQASPNQSWGFKATSQWAELGDKHKFYVIYPDKGSAAFQWYAFFGTSGIGRNDLEPKAIADMVKAMQEKHNIDPSKIFVNGLSAGAYMAVVMLATYPDLFVAGSTFAGGAYGCSTSCAALGKKGNGWTWPGNHASTLVTNAHPAVWKDASKAKPRLLIFQGEADGAVTSENRDDLFAQWSGALGVSATSAAASQLKGHDYKEIAKDGKPVLAALTMKGIGHGTPVDPGSGPDQGGWDPEPSKTASADANATQDWTNTAGIWGPYYSAKFFGLIQ
jgi:poly(hydroxyalkanoate) depolymerase family esterase